MAEKGLEEGNNLVQKMIQDKLVTKYRLAKDLGVSETTVRDWCKDLKSPSRENYVRLKDYQLYLHKLSRLPKWNKSK